MVVVDLLLLMLEFVKEKMTLIGTFILYAVYNKHYIL